MSWGERAQLAELRAENERLKKRLKRAFIAGWNIAFYRDRTLTGMGAEDSWQEYLMRTDEEGE